MPPNIPRVLMDPAKGYCDWLKKQGREGIPMLPDEIIDTVILVAARNTVNRIAILAAAKGIDGPAADAATAVLPGAWVGGFKLYAWYTAWAAKKAAANPEPRQAPPESNGAPAAPNEPNPENGAVPPSGALTWQT